MRRVIAFALLLTVFPFVGFAQLRIETGFLDRQITMNGQTSRYQVYVPLGYTPESAWPVIMDLHGDGWQGTDGQRHTSVGLANYIRQDRTRFPVIALFPQAPPNAGWPQREMQDLAIAQLDQTIREFKVDSSRQYLTGFSMGAMGAYRFAYRWADRFAAIVAIAGRVQSHPTTSPAYTLERVEADRKVNAFVAASDPFVALTQRIAHVPIWIFHGAADESVPVEQSRTLVPVLQKAGAHVRYMEYPDTDHVGGAQKAYADPEMIKWLLAQRRK